MREINHRKRMKNKFNMIVSLWCALIVVFATGCSSVEQEEKQKKQEKQATPQMQNGFWDEQRKGTNFMNSTSLPENYEEANKFNIEFIRLAPDAVLGNDYPEVSVPGEIKPVTEFYDYDSKYTDGSTALIIPAELPEETESSLKDLAKRAFKAIDGSGLVRADFFVTADHSVYINEVNTLPGFTPVSMYPLLWQHTNVSYPELINRLITLAIERFEEKQQLHYKKD